MTNQVTAITQLGEWEIDTAHSNVGFVVRHLMISNVRGRFAAFSGKVRAGASPEASSVEVEIDASSIDTGVPDRDAHLRSADFFDVERFPTLHFRSTKVVPAGDDRFTVEGDLTIRDVTRTTKLDVTYHGAGADPWGNTRGGFSARADIDREDFGLTWNQALETGGVIVGKNVRIEIELEAVQQAVGQAAA